MMHASDDIRIIKCLDGLHYSFETLEFLYSSLYETCLQIREDQGALIPALWKCWSFIDVLHRIREISQALPGLSKKNRELITFLKATEVAEEFRHYIQHLRNELSKTEYNKFPVWGSLSWVDDNDPTKTCLIVIGAQIAGTSYTSCYFDTKEKKWASKVSLSIDNRSFNYDPIYETSNRFREFIIPWTLSTYKPGIKTTTELPIMTFQALVGDVGEHKNEQ